MNITGAPIRSSPTRWIELDAEAHEVRPCVGVVSVSRMLRRRKTDFASTTKKVKSLMTGEEIEIPSNTPNFCNPASESYWSM